MASVNENSDLQHAIAAAQAVAPLVESVEEATGLDLTNLASRDEVLAKLGWDYVELLELVEQTAEEAVRLSDGQASSVAGVRCRDVCRRANAVLGQVSEAIDARLSALSISLLIGSEASAEGTSETRSPSSRPDNG
jgi:hypothetical protein